jgi:sialidase-1
MIYFRNYLNNSYLKLINDDDVNVVFQGGSISYHKWVQFVKNKIRSFFPKRKNKIRFQNYSGGGLTSAWAALSFDNNVLSKCLPDLLIIEWAINDLSNQYIGESIEGIIRKALKANPNMDIVVIYFYRRNLLKIYQERGEEQVIPQHEEILKHYNIPSIDVSREAFRLITEEGYSSDDILMDNCHPTELGCEKYANYINSFFELTWGNYNANALYIKPHFLPEPLFKDNFEMGKLINLDNCGEWTIVPDFVSTHMNVDKLYSFSKLSTFESKTPNEIMTLSISGSILGFELITGPDSGILEYSINNGKYLKFDTFDKYSREKYRRKFIIIPFRSITEPYKGEHTFKLRASDKKNELSNGYAIRVLDFYSA